jgi:hypothetical protein
LDCSVIEEEEEEEEEGGGGGGGRGGGEEEEYHEEEVFTAVFINDVVMTPCSLVFLTEQNIKY